MKLILVAKNAEMATRGQENKDLLGRPDSVLDVKWLETFFAGGAYEDIIPWEFKNKVQLPTKKQVTFL